MEGSDKGKQTFLRNALPQHRGRRKKQKSETPLIRLNHLFGDIISASGRKWLRKTLGWHQVKSDKKQSGGEIDDPIYAKRNFLTAQMSVLMVFGRPHLPLAFQFVYGPGCVRGTEGTRIGAKGTGTVGRR